MMPNTAASPVLTPRAVSSRALAGLTVLALAFLSACADVPRPVAPDAETIANLTITARPGTPTQTAAVGYTQLGIAVPRDGYFYVPPSYDPATPAPLLVLLHGAGGGHDMWATSDVAEAAEQHGLVILAIDSRYMTWDLLQTGRYDVDVAFLNQALLHLFQRVNIDSTRTAIGGFSDGASEALGIGIANAALFRRIIAFSPGTLVLPFSRGQPAIFVSHGDADPTLSFANTQNNIVPRLLANGMSVRFVGFQGGHEIPDVVKLGAIQWLFE